MEKIPTEEQARVLRLLERGKQPKWDDAWTDCCIAHWILVVDQNTYITDAGRAALQRWRDR